MANRQKECGIHQRAVEHALAIEILHVANCIAGALERRRRFIDEVCVHLRLVADTVGSNEQNGLPSNATGKQVATKVSQGDADKASAYRGCLDAINGK